MENRREVWQRGPIENIPSLLQPIAHALLEVGEEAHIIMDGFPITLLWERPAGTASPAFHLQHINGVIDRLFTYARKELLSEKQMNEISMEGNKEKTSFSMQQMIDQLDSRITRAVSELKNANPATLTEFRGNRQEANTNHFNRLVCSRSRTFNAAYWSITCNGKSAERN